MRVNTDGTVKSHQKISSTEGGFTGMLDDFDWFGTSVASLGDLDGDGVGDLGVGALTDDDGGPWRGAVWVLFLNPDGTVKSHQKISDTEGGFDGTESTFENRAGLFDQTILTGDLLGDDGPNFANNDENSYHVATDFGRWTVVNSVSDRIYTILVFSNPWGCLTCGRVVY